MLILGAICILTNIVLQDFTKSFQTNNKEGKRDAGNHPKRAAGCPESNRSISYIENNELPHR